MPIGLIGIALGAAVGVATGAISLGTALVLVGANIVARILAPDVPEIAQSPTYAADRVGNTISEGVPVSRCYGKCKIGGNKLRLDHHDTDHLAMIVGHCQGPVEGAVSYEVNDNDWALIAGDATKTEYTGTRTQTPNSLFSDKASAYRGIAYTAFHFDIDNQRIGYDPNTTVVMEGLLCAPLAGGADAFTRNPAVILYDWYLNVEGYAAGDLDLNAFKSLAALCDEVPADGTLPRYRFDFNIDVNMAINDAKKLIWQSFNGAAIMSQGKIKPVWDSNQMANGSGGLTAKTVSHAFTMDNIVKGSFTWKQPEAPNVVRIIFKDSGNSYKTSSVEIKDELRIETEGEILYEESALFITDPEITGRRARFKFNWFKYSPYECALSSFPDAGDLEIYDLVTVTHSLPNPVWATKQFIVMSKGEDHVGLPRFTLRAYNTGIYDDSQVGVQGNEAEEPVNPYYYEPGTLVITYSDNLNFQTGEDKDSLFDGIRDSGGLTFLNCCDDGYVAPTDNGSDTTIDYATPATVIIKDGCAPYNWAVSGTGYSIDTVTNGKTFNHGDLNVTTNRITLIAHGLGNNGAYIDLKYIQGTGAITGMTDGTVYQFRIIDANTIEIVSADPTDAGAGTGHNLAATDSLSAVVSVVSGTCGIQYAVSCTVTITDVCGNTVTHTLRHTAGTWGGSEFNVGITHNCYNGACTCYENCTQALCTTSPPGIQVVVGDQKWTSSVWANLGEDVPSLPCNTLSWNAPANHFPPGGANPKAWAITLGFWNSNPCTNYGKVYHCIPNNLVHFHWGCT